MSEEQTHYDVLGLPRDASPEQIKKRYRELARKFHPDLNPNQPDAQRRFIEISRVYEVLSDPVRRASYDLTLRDRARNARPTGNAAYPGPSGPSGPAGGAGRPAPPPRAGGSAMSERERRLLERMRQAAQRLLDDAHQAYLRGHLGEAYRLAREVLQQERVAVDQAGGAYELLGDVAGRQQRYEEAVMQYTQAVQRLPRHVGRIMAKLNAAEARMAQVREVDLEGMRDRIAGVPSAVGKMGYRLSVTSFGLAAILFLLFWRPATEDTALNLPLVPSWSLTHLAFLSLDGFLCGAVLAAAAWIRPIDQELFYQSLGSPRRSFPLGLILALFGAIFLPVAFGIYLVIAYMQQAISASVLSVMGASILLTFGFILSTGLSPQAQTETLLFGGNVVFLSMLVGWFIGDLFRPAWAM